MQRHVLHLDLDAFFVSVEQLFDNRLRGIPLIVGGGTDRGVVAACSYEARAFGIHAAMPMRQAKQLCPHATVVKGDFEHYTYFSRMVTDIIAESAPTYEKASIDEFYLDLTGMDKFLGCFKFSHELKKRIERETGLGISFGLAANKLVSKVATGQVKPNGQCQIPYGSERNYLAPLPIEKLPMVGKKTAITLRTMGVSKVQTLQTLQPELLYAALGKPGRLLWERANGIDNTPVEPYNERKSISAEHTFEQDTTDMKQLFTQLAALTERLANTLRQAQNLTSQLSVKIRYADFETHTKQQKIAYTAADHLIWPQVKNLFEQLYNRRLRIRLVGVQFAGLVHGNYQIDLFDDSSKRIQLYQTIDKINARYGKMCVHKAISHATP